MRTPPCSQSMQCSKNWTKNFLRHHQCLTNKIKNKIFVIISFLLVILCFISAYLQSILKNHTAHACEGEMFSIECPSRTSVAILSAFYGRRVPYKHLCPAANANITEDDDTECISSVAMEVHSMRTPNLSSSMTHSCCRRQRSAVFSCTCRRCCQNVRTSSHVTSRFSVQCLDWTPVPSPPSTS